MPSQDPTTLCTELGLCNSTMRAVGVLEPSRLVPAAKITPVAETKKIQSPQAGPECIICEFAMRELDSMLGDNATKVSYGEGVAGIVGDNGW